MFMNPFRSGLAPLLIAGASVALAAGCGGSNGAYAPSATSARKALDDSLATWQKGGKPETLASASPPIHPVDFQWQAGQAIEGYQIVEEEPDTGVEKRFSVVLKLKKPVTEKKVGYVVIGREAIWVYRDDDYARLINMDNNPRPAAKSRR